MPLKDTSINYGATSNLKRSATIGEVEALIAESQANVEADLSLAIANTNEVALRASVTVQYSENMESMLATDYKKGDIVKTLGHYTANDGGGGTYKIVDNVIIITGVSVYQLSNGLKAMLIIENNTINPKQFGAKGNGIVDDKPSLTSSVNFACQNNLIVDLLSNNTYLIGSNNGGSTHLFEITGGMTLKGNSTIKIGAIGDYESTFRLRLGANNVNFEDFTLDDNASGNTVTGVTGTYTGVRRIPFYGINASAIKNIKFNNVKIKDTVGVWQIIMHGEKVQLTNSVVEYATSSDPLYDRTCIYMLGADWNVNNNKFIGSAQALTCMETHGKNMTVENNTVENFKNPLFIVNDAQAGFSNLGTINILNNKITSRWGIRLWMSLPNINIDNINIRGNTLKVTEGSYGLLTYYEAGLNVVVDKVKIENNDVTCLAAQTNSFIELYNTQTTVQGGVTYNDFYIQNNTFNGTCEQPIKIHVQPNKSQTFKKLSILKNTFNVTMLYADKLISMIDTPLGFEDIDISDNKFNVLAVNTGITTVRAINGSIGSRSIGFGNVKMSGNKYNIPSGVTFGIANSEGVKFLSVNEILDRDIVPIVGKVAYAGLLRDTMQQSIEFRSDGTVKQTFIATSKPTSGAYKKGDYVRNTALPVLSGTAGSQYILKGWIRLTDTTGASHTLNTDWVEDRVLTGT